MTFDLRERPFIDVVTVRGEAKSVGLLQAFREASTIRDLCHSCPLDDFAVYRFMLAVLQWVRPSISDEEDSYLRGKGAFPPSWIDEISCRIGDRFDLFHPERPFLQSRSAEGADRPVADLFCEMPAGTTINHFRHAYDGREGVCPACCARGILRLAPFCTIGGQGKAASINDAPPVYFLPRGRTVLETLRLNWPMEETAGDKPAWENAADSTQVGVLQGFTWQPRQVTLKPELAASEACALCGQQERDLNDRILSPRLVRWIGFRKGRKPPDERTAPWHEPHGAYTRKTKTALLRCAEPFKWPLLATAQWRRLARAILDTLAIPDAGTGIEAVRRANQTVSSSQPLVVRIFLPYSRQAKWLDARQDVWEIPGEIRGNPLYLNELTAELDWADSLSFRLRKLLAKAVLPLKASRKAKDLDSVWTVSAAKFEDGLERCFRSLLACLPKASETSEARKTWREEARRMCLELVEPTALKSPSAGVLESICQERIFTGQLNKLVKGGLP